MVHAATHLKLNKFPYSGQPHLDVQGLPAQLLPLRQPHLYKKDDLKTIIAADITVRLEQMGMVNEHQDNTQQTQNQEHGSEPLSLNDQDEHHRPEEEGSETQNKEHGSEPLSLNDQDEHHRPEEEGSETQNQEHGSEPLSLNDQEEQHSPKEEGSEKFAVSCLLAPLEPSSSILREVPAEEKKSVLKHIAKTDIKSKGAKRKWTEDEEAILLNMVQAGTCSKQAIESAIVSQGVLQQRKYTEIRHKLNNMKKKKKNA